jgi:hypothetical protein
MLHRHHPDRFQDLLIGKGHGSLRSQVLGVRRQVSDIRC